MMKKNKLLLKIALIIICGIFCSSCLKDKAPGDENYSHSPALVSFQYLGFSPVPFVASVLGTPQDTISIEVTLSVASTTLQSAVTATITADAPSLTVYNADTTTSTYPTSFVQLPSSDYTLPNGGVVTINPGQQIVNFIVHFAGDKIDFTQDNALALKITDSKGATVATNLNTAIIILKLRSIYEGNYTGVGARIRFNGSNEASGIRDSFAVSGVIPFATLTAKEIDGQLGDAGSGYSMALLIDDSGTPPYPVTVLPDPATVGSGGSPSSIIAGTSRGQSTYDPTTKTFDLHFGYLNSAGALREVNETLVFTP
jgi:Domain of unknown function (DUF1735)